MPVTRVKVSDISLPSSLVTEYSMTRTAMPGMSAGAAPWRRIRFEAAGSAIRDRYVPSGRTLSTGRSTSLFARHSTCTPAPVNALSSPCERKLRPASTKSPRLSRGSSLRASGCSPAASGDSSAPSTARVPHSPRPTTRTCGNGPGRRRCPDNRTPPRSPPWRARPGTSRPARPAASRPRTPSPGPPRPAARPPRPAAAASPASPAAGAPGSPPPARAACPLRPGTGTARPSPGPRPACPRHRRSRTGRTAPSPAAGTPPPGPAASASAARGHRPHRQPGPPARAGTPSPGPRSRSGPAAGPRLPPAALVWPRRRSYTDVILT